MITCHCRLVKVIGERILTNKPIYADAGDNIPPGSPIVVHVPMSGIRYQFESTVEGNLSGMDACRDDPMVGLALRKPDVVDDSRRRSNLRLSVTSLDPIDVMMVCPAPGNQTACLVDAARIHGRLLDISVGGASVLIDQKLLHGGGRIEKVYLTFRLPGETEEFCMLGSLRHAQLDENRDALRIGYRAHPWCKETFDRDQKRIAGFIERHAQLRAT
jgi:hypothetical protein